MPLDPSIPLSVQPLRMPSIADIQARVAQARSQVNQSQLEQQQIQRNDAAFAESKRQAVGRDTLTQLIQQHTTTDPKTGKPTPDYQAIANGLGAQGFPDLAESWLKSAAANAETLDKFAESARAHNARTASAIGDLAYRSNSHADFTANVAQAAIFGLIDKDDANQLEQEEAHAGPNGWQTLKAKYQQFSPDWQKQQEALKKPVTLHEGDVMNTPERAGEKLPPLMAGAPKPSEKQAKSVLLDDKPAEVVFDPKLGKYFDATGADVSARVKPIPPASTIINPQAATDVKETVAGMKDGTLPPMMPGRATKEYLATMAEAHRQGYDLQAAVTDWNATQKHIATLNGNQQTRLNQSINALPELLDSVEALAEKWKGGKFPLLNKANLALAKGGLYGSDVASVANQLAAQIADVNADLGAVYMGGNSPTDHALDLASKSLKGEWDEKVLKDMIGLARKNVTIRQNSIKHTSVQGASANNPYVPPTASAPEQTPKRVYYDAQGNPK